MTESTERRRRGGGRAGHARRAGVIEQMPWRIPENPDRPTEPLSPDGVERLHRGCLRILAEIGIEFLNPEACALFREAGCRVEGTNVRMDGDFLMAMLARMTRSSMVEVLGEDFLRTARAKGLPEGTVIFKHALRNALLPVITIAGLQFGSMLSGAIITEKAFARPGIGLLLLDSIAERNYPVVQGCVLVIAVSYVLVNILVDLAYGLADPRIRRA